MLLAELKTGSSGVIAKVNGHGSFRKRLIEMGFISGKKVKVVLNAPLQDPIEYEIMGYKLSLRREEARMIEVVSEEEVTEEEAEGIVSRAMENALLLETEEKEFLGEGVFLGLLGGALGAGACRL